MKGYNAKEDPRHDRRTIGLDELHTLIRTAEKGPPFRSMTGPLRALCYRLAASTGLRFSELGSVIPSSFDWKATSVTVAAAYTKNGDPATLTIPDDLAADLRPYVATLAPGSPVFPLPKGRGADMLKSDLAAAEIPYKDEAGRVFDFHSLRCETATLADAAGVSPRTVQKLMRHCSLELTGRYTRPRAVDVEATAGMLPSLKPAPVGTDSLAKTGTEDSPDPKYPTDLDGPGPGNSGPETPSHKEPLAPYLLHFPTTEGRGGSPSVVMEGSKPNASGGHKSLKSAGLAAESRDESSSVANDRAGTRTQDQRIKSPLLYRLSYPVSGDFQITPPGRARPYRQCAWTWPLPTSFRQSWAAYGATCRGPWIRPLDHVSQPIEIAPL